MENIASQEGKKKNFDKPGKHKIMRVNNLKTLFFINRRGQQTSRNLEKA
jgi:hypothetical protein